MASGGKLGAYTCRRSGEDHTGGAVGRNRNSTLPPTERASGRFERLDHPAKDLCFSIARDDQHVLGYVLVGHSAIEGGLGFGLSNRSEPDGRHLGEWNCQSREHGGLNRDGLGIAGSEVSGNRAAVAEEDENRAIGWCIG